jgi:hypothetical protein
LRIIPREETVETLTSQLEQDVDSSYTQGESARHLGIGLHVAIVRHGGNDQLLL